MGGHRWPSAQRSEAAQSTRPVDHTRCVEPWTVTQSLQEPSTPRENKDGGDTLRLDILLSKARAIVPLYVVIRNRPYHHYWHDAGQKEHHQST